MNLLVDGNSLFATQYFGFASGIYGFYNGLATLIKKHNPDEIHLAFDSHKNWRKELYPPYKATRAPKPEGYYSQLQALKQALYRAQFAVYEIDGYEADDVLNSLLYTLGTDNLIFSGDKDILQLVGYTNHVIRSSKTLPWRVSDVKDKFGILPAQIPSYLALVGDTVDCIPGVKGIGPVKAKELLADPPIFLNELYQDIPKGITGAKLIAYEADARLSLQLATLANPPITLRPGSYNMDSLRQEIQTKEI